jgi:hypothetical protein
MTNQQEEQGHHKDDTYCLEDDCLQYVHGAASIPSRFIIPMPKPRPNPIPVPPHPEPSPPIPLPNPKPPHPNPKPSFSGW